MFDLLTKKSNWYLPLIVLFFFTLPFSRISQADDFEDEIGGLVIDRTLTRFGKEFYQDFSAEWRSVKGANRYTIVVIEKPLPQSGTVLYIEFRTQKVFQTFFGRRKSVTNEKLAKQAIGVVLQHLAVILDQEQHPDLSGDGY